MPHRSPESYPASGDVPGFPFPEPGVAYCPDSFPDVAESLRAINLVAGADENMGFLEGVAVVDDSGRLFLGLLAECSEHAVNHGLSVVSFDIDLTLVTPDDAGESAGGVVPVGTLSVLREMGYIVGTCSDRLVTDQRQLMGDMGFEPDFCVPKSMLGPARAMLPGPSHIHVGDDPTRDRDIALRAGWEHRWPAEAVPQA